MSSGELAKLAVSLAVCLGAGFIGSLFTRGAIPTWYAALNKPAFNPPNWVFAPVWTILYILMGIAAWLVWRRGPHTAGVKLALAFFALQLVLNIAWSVLFFYCHSPFYAYLEIVALWAFIVLTIVFFHQVSKPAAWLLLPYLLWVSFASVLNFVIWRLN
ncbi:MAG: tryptophan-rich sensory protein [Candidatus Saganbacteria bacterium]|nr:tryptophan-rich sensory protein [Candidatus Saganbacteria bacterium]